MSKYEKFKKEFADKIGAYNEETFHRFMTHAANGGKITDEDFVSDVQKRLDDLAADLVDSIKNWSK